jgi:hypothetical protein
MSRKDQWWIHRGALYQALGFMSGKIPLDHEEIRENVTIPLGISYERILENDGRHTGHYKYHGTHSFVGTVIIRAKVQRYTEKVRYYPRQVSRRPRSTIQRIAYSSAVRNAANPFRSDVCINTLTPRFVCVAHTKLWQSNL